MKQPSCGTRKPENQSITQSSGKIVEPQKIAIGLKANGKTPLIHCKTGLVVDAYISATKIAWLLKHVRVTRALARQSKLAFGTIDSWLIWKLTAGNKHITDTSNASSTMLYNLSTDDWDPELLKVFKIPRNLLPEICGSSEVVGETKLLGKTIPIARPKVTETTALGAAYLAGLAVGYWKSKTDISNQ